MIFSKTQRCVSATNNHFNDETFFDKFEQQICLALTVNCKGQQNCSHTMECNSNDKQDSSKRSNEFLKLYLHKAVMGVLEGPLFFNAKKDLLRALPVDPSCYASQLVTSSAMPKVQVVDESKVHIQSRIFPWKPIFPKHLKGCVCYICASLFFESKRKHLSNYEKCFSLQKLFSFSRKSNFRILLFQISWRHQMSNYKTRNTFHWITWEVNAVC